ncbi:sporulation histidine kinase inhibitor Sda [Neobacillus sp. LXY-4]
MSSLDILTDQDLIEILYKANKYQLEKEFIDTLLTEIERRGLGVAVS